MRYTVHNLAAVVPCQSGVVELLLHCRLHRFIAQKDANFLRLMISQQLPVQLPSPRARPPVIKMVLFIMEYLLDAQRSKACFESMRFVYKAKPLVNSHHFMVYIVSSPPSYDLLLKSFYTPKICKNA